MSATPGPLDEALDPVVEDLNRHRLDATTVRIFDLADESPTAPAPTTPLLAEHRTRFDAVRRLWRFAIFDVGALDIDDPLAMVTVTPEALRRMPRRVLVGDVRLGLVRQLVAAGHLPA